VLCALFPKKCFAHFFLKSALRTFFLKVHYKFNHIIILPRLQLFY
jgi:hypothetical protein